MIWIWINTCVTAIDIDTSHTGDNQIPINTSLGYNVDNLHDYTNGVHNQNADNEFASEESDPSEDEDNRLLQLQMVKKKKKRRRKRKKTVERRRISTINADENMINDYMSDPYDHEFIGEPLEQKNKSGNIIRVATNNINKGLIWKMEEEVERWFIRNSIDIMIISDPGSQMNGKKTIWTRDEAGKLIPGIVMIGNNYTAVLIDEATWADRTNFKNIKYSESGRSMFVPIKIEGQGKIAIIATYMPPNPFENANITERELSWISDCIKSAENNGHRVILAGDINNYCDETLDRQSANNRTSAAINQAEILNQWLLEHRLKSTFRIRHPLKTRYTYEHRTENGITRTALDDIYISASLQEQVLKSGIEINVITNSDHIGTPYTDIMINPRYMNRNKDQQVTAIKTIPVKGRTIDEYIEFKFSTQEMIEDNPGMLIREPEQDAPLEYLIYWLEKAIINVHNILYQSAKALWGETSNARKQINRHIAIKKSNICNGQFKKMIREQGPQRYDTFKKINWPNWVYNINVIPDECDHKNGVKRLVEWKNRLENTTDVTDRSLNEGWKIWKSVLRSRRNWRKGRKRIMYNQLKKQYMEKRQYKKLINNILGNKSPPVNVHSVIANIDNEETLIANKQAVKEGLINLLDNWIPIHEKTTRPEYLNTRAEEDKVNLPEFVREWMLQDIEEGGILKHKFYDEEGNSLWECFKYDENTQSKVDKLVSRGVAPGEGGVAQELWIYAPDAVRQRERVIINMIFKIGKIPKCLRDKQMVFLPKEDNISNILDTTSTNLPPWRPITVMRSLSTRLFTAVSCFLDGKISNHITQHGFQRDKTAHDASILTALLFDRAKDKNEAMHAVSKDCLKCFDRIPSWVMELIYEQLGLPKKLKELIISGLGEGAIKVRTRYGWCDTGNREFGIGQGSVMSIIHIGCYMDLLQRRQNIGIDPIEINTKQGNQITIHGVTYVDDQVDYSTTIQGIQQRAHISNIFTGRKGTGGVFGANKSFYLQYEPNRQSFPSIKLANGLNELIPVKSVSPLEGFKHLGVYQSTEKLWSSTIDETWKKFEREAKRVEKMELTIRQIRYIVNHIWIPRFVYRMIATSSIKVSTHIDSRIRKVVKRCLRLPHSTPKQLFYDNVNGMGLLSCKTQGTVSRVYETLRIMNQKNSPVQIVLEDAIERYQAKTGMTRNPMEHPIAPPPYMNSWIAQTIRCMAELQIKTISKWRDLREVKSRRVNDTALWDCLAVKGCQALIQLNCKNNQKLRYLGDICNNRGDRIRMLESIKMRYKLKNAMEKNIEIIYEEILEKMCVENTNKLISAIGYESIQDTMMGQLRSVRIPPQSMLLTSQFEIKDDQIEYTGYEIGMRIDNEVKDDPLSNGTLIRVQWFHTRDERIFTYRPESITWEYDDACIPINVTTCIRSTLERPRYLVWDDTIEHDLTGPNNRSLCQEAFHRVKQRYDQVMRNGKYGVRNNCCYKCKRLIESETCILCNTKHHQQCGHMTQLTQSGTGYFRYTENSTTNNIEAGDGSVILAGTKNASGSWSYIGPLGGITGRINTYWNDINSTRCELHALILGMYKMGDVGSQICDNKSAIALYNNTRNCKNQGKLLILKYSNTYRNEIQALYNLMDNQGARRIIWTKSHQENTYTEDLELKNRRQALAMADEEAAKGHDIDLDGNYDDILVHDKVSLVCEESKIVVGNVRQTLIRITDEKHRFEWIKRLSLKQSAYQTIHKDGLPISKYMYLNSNVQRFYWRAISFRLHTGAMKHKMCNSWSPRCKGCNGVSIDDQIHRFALDNNTCAIASCVISEIQKTVDNILRVYTQPDVTIYIPQRDHELAMELHLETRAMWRQKINILWRPMVQISAGVWVNARQIALLWSTETNLEDIATCFIKEKIIIKTKKDKNIIPVDIIKTAKECLPNIARREFVPTEIMMCIESGTRRNGLFMPQSCQIREPPPSHRAWWIDDTYAPLGAAWWREWVVEIEGLIAEGLWFEQWIAITPGLTLLQILQRLNIHWIVKIPKGQLNTRTDLSVRQFGNAPRKEQVSRATNKSIWIGVIGSGMSVERLITIEKKWYNLCMTFNQPLWLRLASSTWDRPLCNNRHLFDWTNNGSTNCISEAQACDWLQLKYSELYESSPGWKRFPTPTVHLVNWAKAIVDSRSASLHRKLLESVWSTLFTHWCRSSEALRGLIVDEEELLLLDRVNTSIMHARRTHDNTPHTLTRLLEDHRNSLHRRSVRWHRVANSVRSRPLLDMTAALSIGSVADSISIE